MLSFVFLVGIIPAISKKLIIINYSNKSNRNLHKSKLNLKRSHFNQKQYKSFKLDQKDQKNKNG